MSGSDKGIASDNGAASSDNDNEYEIEDDDIDNDTNDENNTENENDEEEEENDEDNDEDSEKDNEETHEGRITSDVWNFVDKTTRKCPSCAKIFKKKTGTSSIRAHLQSHGMLMAKQTTQTTLDNFARRHSQKIQTSKTQAVIEWIVLDIQPFKVIEGEAFRKMILELDPYYVIPTRNTVKSIIKKAFEKRRTSIKEFVKNISGKISFTTDIWSSLKTEGFLGITIHYVNENWILKHFTLDIFRFKGSHTGQAIANEIYKIILDFGLETKAMAITTDNGSNMVAGANILKEKLSLDTFVHCRCVAHVLNLIVTTGLEILKISIKKLRKLITVIRKSTKVLEELENLFNIEGKQFLRPILDCKTRWNSTYQMINRACFLKEYIQMALVRSPDLSSYFPEENEWELYKDLNEFLEQFYDATTTLSSQTYPTIAHSRIILLAIKKDLETSRGNESLLKDAINAMKIKYNEYYKKLESSSHISAFLDPRYKKYCFPEMQDNEIISPIQKLLEQQQPVTSIVPKKTSSFLQKLKEQTTNSLPIVDNEINKYWNSTDADESVKPLEWWKTHSSEYPNLAKLARDYLSIQASSVPCEQLFSIAGQVLCKSRNRLTGESVRACICLRSWILEDIN